MAELEQNPDMIKSLLMSLATNHASRKMVEHLVIGELPFDDDQQIYGDWPSSRIDGIEANYYTFFKSHILSEEPDKSDIQYEAAQKILKNFLTAYEENNEQEILTQGARIFNAALKERRQEYLSQDTIIETVSSMNEFSSMDKKQKEQYKAGLKASFVLKQILVTFRRELANVELEHAFKYSTLEHNIEAIIYATVLITEKILQENEINSDILDSIWQCGGFFCDMWFASTLVSDPQTEKSQSVREQILKVAETWPDYAQNMTFILDYAAIIQDRLFSNRQINPQKDWRKESFKIWNAYAAAALRLGEIYSKYRSRLPLDDDEILKLKMAVKNFKPLIITEGKTDWMHLKNAYKFFKQEGKYQNITLSFWENTDNMGDKNMLRMCQEHVKIPNEKPLIFIADADNPEIIKEMNDATEKFKYWGNKVYSFCLPTPEHRRQYKKISIEFYYTDKEIGTIDPETKRRLLFSNQVTEIIVKNKTTKQHQSSFCICDPIIEDEYEKQIYDEQCDKIKDQRGNFVAHSKFTFAKSIYEGKPGFDSFDLSNFSLVFDVIDAILEHAKTQN